MKSHAAAARAWYGPERSTALDRLLASEEAGGFTPKMQALLAIAGALQNCVLGVRPEHIEQARAAGANDHDIHDTVLITAAFCMYNRYVEGLGTREAEESAYEPMGRRLRDIGYQSAPPAT
jgi:alkylhydroperoxidase/carboxymuconolactone decarboxylase family protein YurZ